MTEFTELINVVKELREKCPWDKEQTMESIKNLTIEEVYELSQAVMEKDGAKIMEELGDLLLHILLYSKIADENGLFNLTDEIKNIKEKLIRRHPHIYGEKIAENTDEVKRNWEEIKLQEGDKSVLGGVPSNLPALIKAKRIQEKVRGVGFDWEYREQVWDKVKEELQELQVEVEKQDKENMEMEFGDFIFAIINAARLYDIDPENALEKTNKKFIKRFNYMESQTIKKGIKLKGMSLDELEKYWNEAKKETNK